MRRAAGTLAAASLLASLVLGALAFVSFRAALSARLDGARDREAEVVRPAAAARLEAALAERRLALVTEKQSQAVAAAFRRADAARLLEAYRRAGGDAALLEEARKALSQEEPAGPAGDVATLRAIRGLREEADRLPPPGRPETPPAARTSGRLLLAAGACACLALLLSRAARPSSR